MIDPTKHRQLEELDTVNLCTQIFTNARNELYLNMHYLDLALSSFGFEADPTLSSVATDGFVIYYRPEWVFAWQSPYQPGISPYGVPLPVLSSGHQREKG